MKLLFSLCCAFISLTLSSQQISGKIINGNNKEVYYANVALYSLPDSVLLDGVASDENGEFTLINVKDGNYYLVASMIGYNDVNSETITIANQHFEGLKLILIEDSQMLDLVTVKARKPLLEQKADRMVVNVADNLTSANGTLLDVMKKVPGMLVINDKLSLAGQQNVTIMLNGKTTRYMDVQSLLRDLPGDNIKSVEIIHQPGAEFEASGSGPIINIITKKNNLFGTNGTVSAGLGYTNDYKYNSGLRMSHYQGALNLQGSVSYARNSWEDILTINRTVPNPNGNLDQYNQVNTDPSLSNTFRAGFTADLDISDEHRIGLNTRIVDSHNKYTASNITDITLQSLGGTLSTSNSKIGGWDMYAINPYYVFTIDTSGHKLELDANWIDFDIERNNVLTNMATDTLLSVRNRENDQVGDNKIFTSKLDYTLPINSNFTIKAGGKYSDANLDNDLKVSDMNNAGIFELNNLQSNQFIFDETVKAAYTKLEYKISDVTGTVGLRYENSLSKGYSVNLDSTLDRTIKQFFPSASISKPISGPLAINLAYSYRIDRPRYSTLNPFVYYYDPFTSDRGNPNVRPELTHSYKFSLAYEGQPFFNVEYKRSKDNMVEVSEQNDETGEISRLTVNLDKFSNFNTSLFIPFDMFLPFGGYIGGIVNHNDYDSDYLGGQFEQDAWSFTGFASATFELPGEISTEISGWYNSGGQEGIINTDWLYGMGLSFSKKFLNKKLNVSLGIEDIFNKFWTGNINYANMNASIRNTWPKNVANLRVSYKFGNQYIKNKKKSRSSANDEMNRVDTSK
jgi:hypothetical protein